MPYSKKQSSKPDTDKTASKYTVSEDSFTTTSAKSKLHTGYSASKDSDSPERKKHYVLKEIINEKESSRALTSKMALLRLQILNCYLSRVLHGVDPETPKTKFAGPNLLASRIVTLDGETEDVNALEHNLHDFIKQNTKSRLLHLTGMLNTILDLILIENWDNKYSNLTRPPVRPFDLDTALHACSHKVKWSEGKLEALILGTSFEENTIPKDLVEGCAEAVAISLSQIFIECGTRVNNYPDYTKYRNSLAASFSKHVIATIIRELSKAKEGTESPSATLVRLLEERAKAIEASRTRMHNPAEGSKNPAQIIKEELKEKVFSDSDDGSKRWYSKESMLLHHMEACEIVDEIDEKLKNNLTKITGMVAAIAERHRLRPAHAAVSHPPSAPEAGAAAAAVSNSKQKAFQPNLPSQGLSKRPEAQDHSATHAHLAKQRRVTPLEGWEKSVSIPSLEYQPDIPSSSASEDSIDKMWQKLVGSAPLIPSPSNWMGM